jgi:hypothetical protein
MRRLLDLRIVRWELKLAYVLGAFFVGFPASALLRLLNVPDILIGLLVGWALNLAVLFLGARIFRGRGEPIQPPRPWWKMTARPRLSKRLGIFFTIAGVWGLPLIVFDAIGVDPPGRGPIPDLFLSIDYVLFMGVLAFLYLNSAVRLKRAGVLPLEPVFRPKKIKLKLK